MGAVEFTPFIFQMSEINSLPQDVSWLRHALQLAFHAEAAGEVPVGAILVHNEKIIGSGWNCPISTCDPTAHAEMKALREGALVLSNYRLLNTTLYVTLEPCAMCAGAIVQARVKRVVFGAFDPRAGAAGSVFNIFESKELNHRVECVGGVLNAECAILLRNFFQQKRIIKG